MAPLVTQFVPLKVDVSTPEYVTLARKHQSEGNSIPKIFLIRADGKKLYAKSGSLQGDQLPTLMSLAVRDMGRPLGISEAQALNEINSKIEVALKEKQFKEATTLFKKVKSLGAFGRIQSYAKSATKNNALAQQFQDSVKALTSQYTSLLDSESSRTKAAIQSLQLKSDVGTFTAFRIPLNQLEKKVRSAIGSTETFSRIKNIASALNNLGHASEITRGQAQSTLKSFADSTNDEQAKQYVAKSLETQGKFTTTLQEPNSALRTWTSDNGKFSIEAALVTFNGVDVTLKKKDGKIISVPASRLSKADQTYLANQ
ncbi:MAG: SHD1 domain-containing protein [Planctomycetota bacterium]|nr:SHD1 domain-containing protein [Planctomycetota bacterium]